MFFRKYFFLVSTCGIVARKSYSDPGEYFGENFDPNKNCEEEKLINKLRKEKHNESPIRCSTVAGVGSDMDNWRKCKKNLVLKLRDMCSWATILEVRRTLLLAAN